MPRPVRPKPRPKPKKTRAAKAVVDPIEKKTKK